ADRALAGAEVLRAPGRLDDVGVAGHRVVAGALRDDDDVGLLEVHQCGVSAQGLERLVPVLVRAPPELPVRQVDVLDLEHVPTTSSFPNQIRLTGSLSK